MRLEVLTVARIREQAASRTRQAPESPCTAGRSVVVLDEGGDDLEEVFFEFVFDEVAAVGNH